MELLACIPLLPPPTAGMPPIADRRTGPPSAEAGAEGAGPVVADASAPSRPPRPRGDRGDRADRHGRSARSAHSRFPTASVAVLVMVAGVLWAAAWRSERQRFEADRDARAARLAAEPSTPTAGDRSVVR